MLNEAPVLNFLLSIILQYTDRLNYPILRFYEENKAALDPLNNGNIDLVLITRLFDAQPFLRQIWNTSILFQIQEDATNQAILYFLRSMILPSATGQRPALEQIDQLHRDLRVDKNKSLEARKSLSRELSEIEGVLAETEDTAFFQNDEGIVATPYLIEKADEVKSEI